LVLTSLALSTFGVGVYIIGVVNPRSSSITVIFKHKFLAITYFYYAMDIYMQWEAPSMSRNSFRRENCNPQHPVRLSSNQTTKLGLSPSS
jgi:hypothetical protein